MEGKKQSQLHEKKECKRKRNVPLKIVDANSVLRLIQLNNVNSNKFFS